MKVEVDFRDGSRWVKRTRDIEPIIRCLQRKKVNNGILKGRDKKNKQDLKRGKDIVSLKVIWNE
ncbi:hypothetical protein [Desmospora profundinema]|uniref:Uncharacterized protein n=1 Tax=Desmospora profundinema TaxID=1571184 RepID=A0ABU1IJ79_9BACL|nr:hypothetical protein [Desmospora profundinema]MDR6224054.1 hypothetical protein [Desmospora profundinema]